MNKHSPLIQPLPWHARRDGGDFGSVMDVNEFCVLTDVLYDEAAFIVRACNLHDELLAALIEAAREVRLYGHGSVADRIEAVIAKAEATHV